MCKVKEFLTRERWTQGELARDSCGKKVEINDPSACSFCLEGALFHCYSEGEYLLHLDRISFALGEPIFEWNDSHTYEEVAALVERLDV